VVEGARRGLGGRREGWGEEGAKDAEVEVLDILTTGDRVRSSLKFGKVSLVDW
jgi:hypothetical protein